jgi:hypothetical protein
MTRSTPSDCDKMCSADRQLSQVPSSHLAPWTVELVSWPDISFDLSWVKELVASFSPFSGDMITIELLHIKPSSYLLCSPVVAVALLSRWGSAGHARTWVGLLKLTSEAMRFGRKKSN